MQQGYKIIAHICNDLDSCGLAGKKWEKIEPLLTSALVDAGVEVYVCDFDWGYSEQ